MTLTRLWEESLYRDFAMSKRRRQHNRIEDPSSFSSTTDLTSSMRYKLRKKHPCPIEMEEQLRVKNARLPRLVHDGLNAWLKRHQDNPYPNREEKEKLSQQLGITPQQVCNYIHYSELVHWNFRGLG